jgi:hypothetical protein
VKHKDIKKFREYWNFLNQVADNHENDREFDRNHAAVFADWLQEQGDPRAHLARHAVGFMPFHRSVVFPGRLYPLHPHPSHPEPEGGWIDGGDRMEPANPRQPNGAPLSSQSVAAFRDNAHSDVTLWRHEHQGKAAPVLHWRAYIPRTVSADKVREGKKFPLPRAAYMTAPVTVEQLHQFIDGLPGATQKQWRETAEAHGWKRPAGPAKLARPDEQPMTTHDALVAAVADNRGDTEPYLNLADHLQDEGRGGSALLRERAAGVRGGVPSTPDGHIFHPVRDRYLQPDGATSGNWGDAQYVIGPHLEVFPSATTNPSWQPASRMFVRHWGAEREAGTFGTTRDTFHYTLPVRSHRHLARLMEGFPAEQRRALHRAFGRRIPTSHPDDGPVTLRSGQQRLARRDQGAPDPEGAGWFAPDGRFFPNLVGEHYPEMHEEALERLIREHAASPIHESLNFIDPGLNENINRQAQRQGWIRFIPVKDGTDRVVSFMSHNPFRLPNPEQEWGMVQKAQAHNAETVQHIGAGYHGKQIYAKPGRQQLARPKGGSGLGYIRALAAHPHVEPARGASRPVPDQNLDPVQYNGDEARHGISLHQYRPEGEDAVVKPVVRYWLRHPTTGAVVSGAVAPDTAGLHKIIDNIADPAARTLWRRAAHAAGWRTADSHQRLARPEQPGSDLLAHAAAVFADPHDDTGYSSFADHFAETHEGHPWSEPLLAWSRGDRESLTDVADQSKYGATQEQDKGEVQMVPQPFGAFRPVPGQPVPPIYHYSYSKRQWERVSRKWVTPARGRPYTKKTVAVLSHAVAARELYELGPDTLVHAIAGMQYFRPPVKLARVTPQTQTGAGGAVRRAATDNHDARVGILRHILREARLSPATARPVLAAGKAGLNPAALGVVRGAASPEHVRYAAAWFGLVANQPAVTTFVPGDGEDTLHLLDTPLDSARVGEYLRKAGVPTFAVESRGAGSRAYVTNWGGKTDLDHIVRGLNARHSAFNGTATKLGGGQAAASDPAGRADYRTAIRDFERAQSAGPAAPAGPTA